jgi:hypothetical protein
MKLSFFCIVTLMLTAFSANAEMLEGVRGTAYGKDHVFSLKAPSGWILDTESGSNEGSGLVFYPVGSTWKNSDVALYVRVLSKQDSKYQTVKQLVELTLQDFQCNGSPNYHIDSQEERTLLNARKAKVVAYSGDQWGNFEIVGYVNERKSINFLVMNARSKESFKAALPIFYEILDSYKFEKSLPACAKKTC